MIANQSPQARRTDPVARMDDAVVMADVGDLAQQLPLPELGREHLPRWIQALTAAETNARQLREALEELLAESTSR